jgi:hypothetical protein
MMWRSRSIIEGQPMSLAVLRSRALAGMEALCVSVEVHLANGLPSLTMVGINLPVQRCRW